METQVHAVQVDTLGVNPQSSATHLSLGSFPLVLLLLPLQTHADRALAHGLPQAPAAAEPRPHRDSRFINRKVGYCMPPLQDRAGSREQAIKSSQAPASVFTSSTVPWLTCLPRQAGRASRENW